MKKIILQEYRNQHNFGENHLIYKFINESQYLELMKEEEKHRKYIENLKNIDMNRKNIKEFKKKLKENLRRRNSEINEQEINTAIQISQLCPKNRDFYLRGLKIVFSPKRAERLLDKIIDTC